MVRLKKTIYYITHWESWHWFAKYILIGSAWLWYCLKRGSLWFFTPVNPTITFGGFVGETKQEVYAQLPAGTYPNSIFIKSHHSISDVMHMMHEEGLTFPLAAKPNSGLMGFMFRRIESMNHLQQYHAYMTADYILQELITYPMEVSVFYYRYPGETKGHITGFIRKDHLEVTGDGRKTLKELMEHYPRVQFKLEEMKSKHANHLHDIIPAGEGYVLSHALNLSRGGKLVSQAHERDEALQKVFDALSMYSGNLFFGRYDIRCTSIDDLKKGQNFRILEFNGCGGEPHHVYGDGNSLWKACRILLFHWKVLDEIAAAHRATGVAPWPHRKGWNHFKKSIRHILTLKQLDKAFVFNDATLPDSYLAPHPQEAMSHIGV